MRGIYSRLISDLWCGSNENDVCGNVSVNPDFENWAQTVWIDIKKAENYGTLVYSSAQQNENIRNMNHEPPYLEFDGATSYGGATHYLDSDSGLPSCNLSFPGLTQFSTCPGQTVLLSSENRFEEATPWYQCGITGCSNTLNQESTFIVQGKCDTCGNFVLDAGEQCDEGPLPTDSCVACRRTVCGDRILNANEACEQDSDCPAGLQCTNNCTCQAAAIANDPILCNNCNDSCSQTQICDLSDCSCKNWQCTSNADCADADACTTDTCQGGVCRNLKPYNPTNPLCASCSSNTDCNDNTYCTTDTCVNGQCQHVPNADPACKTVNPAPPAASCRDECTAGYAACDGAGAQYKCGQFDTDPCLDLAITSCGSGNECRNGSCGPYYDCTNDCNPTQLGSGGSPQSCLNINNGSGPFGLVYTCGQFDNDPCTENNNTSCPVGITCSGSGVGCNINVAPYNQVSTNDTGCTVPGFTCIDAAGNPIANSNKSKLCSYADADYGLDRVDITCPSGWTCQNTATGTYLAGQCRPAVLTNDPGCSAATQWTNQCNASMPEYKLVCKPEWYSTADGSGQTVYKWTPERCQTTNWEAPFGQVLQYVCTNTPTPDCRVPSCTTNADCTTLDPDRYCYDPGFGNPKFCATKPSARIEPIEPKPVYKPTNKSQAFSPIVHYYNFSAKPTGTLSCGDNPVESHALNCTNPDNGKGYCTVPETACAYQNTGAARFTKTLGAVTLTAGSQTATTPPETLVIYQPTCEIEPFAATDTITQAAVRFRVKGIDLTKVQQGAQINCGNGTTVNAWCVAYDEDDGACYGICGPYPTTGSYNIGMVNPTLRERVTNQPLVACGTRSLTITNPTGNEAQWSYSPVVPSGSTPSMTLRYRGITQPVQATNILASEPGRCTYTCTPSGNNGTCAYTCQNPVIYERKVSDNTYQIANGVTFTGTWFSGLAPHDVWRETVWNLDDHVCVAGPYSGPNVYNCEHVPPLISQTTGGALKTDKLVANPNQSINVMMRLDGMGSYGYLSGPTTFNAQVYCDNTKNQKTTLNCQTSNQIFIDNGTGHTYRSEWDCTVDADRDGIVGPGEWVQTNTPNCYERQFTQYPGNPWYTSIGNFALCTGTCTYATSGTKTIEVANLIAGSGALGTPFAQVNDTVTITVNGPTCTLNASDPNTDKKFDLSIAMQNFVPTTGTYAIDFYCGDSDNEPFARTASTPTPAAFTDLCDYSDDPALPPVVVRAIVSKSGAIAECTHLIGGNVCIPSGAENTVLACSDGIDNDCDGQIDCFDSDCRAPTNHCEQNHLTCANNACALVAGSGIDDCTACGGGHTTCNTTNQTCELATGAGTNSCNPVETCNDNTDNDCDQLLDCSDPDCTTNPLCATTHAACTPASPYTCYQASGTGSNACTTNEQCEPGNSHLACISNACTIQTGPGPNQCTGNGTACACTPAETNCNDGIDNDCNNDLDCDDAACTNDPACAPACVATEQPEQTCFDGIDNDCDGQIDCGILGMPGSEDPDCQAACATNTHAICSNNACISASGAGTNQCASAVNCTNMRLACNAGACTLTSGSGANTCTPGNDIENTSALCQNGLDDDCDGDNDCDDAGCASQAFCANGNAPGDYLISEFTITPTKNPSDVHIALIKNPRIATPNGSDRQLELSLIGPDNLSRWTTAIPITFSAPTYDPIVLDYTNPIGGTNDLIQLPDGVYTLQVRICNATGCASGIDDQRVAFYATEAPLSIAAPELPEWLLLLTGLVAATALMNRKPKHA